MFDDKKTLITNSLTEKHRVCLGQVEQYVIMQLQVECNYVMIYLAATVAAPATFFPYFRTNLLPFQQLVLPFVVPSFQERPLLCLQPDFQREDL